MKTVCRTMAVVFVGAFVVGQIVGCGQKGGKRAVKIKPVQCKCTACGADFPPEAKINLTKPGHPEGALPEAPLAYKCPKCGKYAVYPARKCSKCGKWFVPESEIEGVAEDTTAADSDLCPECQKKAK